MILPESDPKEVKDVQLMLRDLAVPFDECQMPGSIDILLQNLAVSQVELPKDV